MAEPAALEGQATIWNQLLGFIDNKLLKCVVELGIADIIKGQGQPISLPRITQHLPSSSSDTHTSAASLHRILGILVNKGVFSGTRDPTTGEALYGLTPTSRWLLRDAELSLVPMVLLNSHPAIFAAWDCLSSCVREGFTTTPFKRANGFELLDLAAADPEFNRLFNDAMACTAKATISAVLSAYEDGFLGFGTIVDVGGGTGMALSTIMMACPHILQGINFDLPHVVASAPDYPGITHVGGDMFESVPHADAVLLKRILHGFEDEDCVKILKNCQKAISKKTGKVIIVEVVLNSSDGSPFEDSPGYFDLLMLACNGGKERTEAEWKRLLLSAGFSRCDIIQIPAMQSIIEASIE